MRFLQPTHGLLVLLAKSLEVLLALLLDSCHGGELVPDAVQCDYSQYPRRLCKSNTAPSPRCAQHLPLRVELRYKGGSEGASGGAWVPAAPVDARSARSLQQQPAEQP